MSMKQIEGEEVDVDWLRLVKSNHDVNVRLAGNLSLNGLPHECNLLAVSNTWGLIIAAGDQDVRIHRLSEVHTHLESSNKDAEPSSTPIQIISLPSRAVWVRLAMNEENLVLGLLDGSIHIYNLGDILRGQTTPYHTITANIPTQLIDLLPNPAGPSTDSPSRYIALLGKEGMVLADIEERKLAEPVVGPFTSGCWSAKGKQIVLGSPDGRLIQYTPEGVIKAEIPPPELENPSYPSSVQWLDTNLFLVAYAPTDGEPDDPLDIFVISRTKTELVYTKFYDPLNTMGVQGRSGSFRFYAGLKQWGEKTKYLGFMMSGLASEVAVLHGMEDQAPVWEVLMLEETARAIMPIGKAGEEDMSCIGLDLDLTSTKPIRRGIVDGVELPNLPPPPRLLVYTQKGVIISFNVQYPDAGAYPGMIAPQEIKEGEVVSASVSQTSTPAASETSTGFNGFGSGFGQSAFGAPAQASTPAFGSSSSGSSAFGALSQPSGGFAGFGQSSTTPTSTPSKPTAFTGFGQSTTPSSTPSKPAAFGGAAPAFGSSGFGQSSTPTGFGASAFGQKPAFGQSSTPSFGSTSIPSAFGSTSSPSSGGFSAFGNTKPMAAQTGFGFGTSGFGSTAKEQPKPPSTGGSAFGASSGFGQSAFGTPSWGSTKSSSPAGTQTSAGFGGFGQQSTSTTFGGFGQSKAVSPAPSPAPKQKAADDFGLGGFASVLETKTDIPGLADSPPTSPVLGSGRPSGLEDESPPGSPTFTPPQPKPVSQPSSSSSSFIKPATAFGGTSSAFSGFGSSSSSSTPKTPAFGSGTTPPAFSNSPAPSTSSTPAFGQSSGISKPTFGGSAFGQSSKPSGSAFGQTVNAGGGFGNISGGFGGFAAKAAGGDNGAQSGGGFGGFAAKASSTTSAFGQGSGFGFGAAKKDGDGDIFATGKAKKEQDESTSSHPTEFPSTAKEVKNDASSLLPPDTPLSPAQSSGEEGYEVSTSGKAEEAVVPAGYDKPDVSTSPIVKPEPAVLPEGYDKPAEPVSSTEPEVAVLPEGYDVPVAVKSDKGGDEQEEVVEAVQTALPDEGLGENEKEDTADAATKVALLGVKTEEVDDDEEGVVVDDGGVMVHRNDEEEYDEEDFEEEEEDVEGEEYEEEDAEDRDDGEDEEEAEEEEETPSELSMVNEELEEEQEGQTEKAGTKSPPTWFTSDSSGSTTQTPEPPSLFSRLGPLPPPPPPGQSQQNKFSFANRHAAKTASPLGSQPPQTPEESSTPPISPMRPSSVSNVGGPMSNGGGFDLFGKETVKMKPVESIFAPKPAPSDEKPIDVKSEPKPSFNFGLGKPPAAAIAKEAPSTAPSTGLSLDLAKPSNTAQSQNQKSAFGFGLGLGQPPAQAAGKSAFDFGLNKSSAKEMPAQTSGHVKSLASVFESPPKAEKASAPFTFDKTTAPAVTKPSFGSAPESKSAVTASASQPVTKPPSLPPATSFTLPTRQNISPRTQRKDDRNLTMAGVLEGMIQDLEADMRQLQLYLSAAEKQHAALRDTNFVKITLNDLEKHTALPFSSIKETSAIAEDLLKQLQEYKRKDTGIDTRLAELQSLLLKTDMKSGQLEQYAKARDDPDFVKGIEVTQLSAQQAADQARINDAIQSVEAGLEDLEMGLAVLQRRLDEVKKGESSGSPVEKLEGSVRALDRSIQDKQQSLDDLSRRLSSIKVSTPARSPRPTAQYISLTPPATTWSTPTTRVALPVPSEIQDEVRQALETNSTARFLEMLKDRQTRLTNATTSRSNIFSHSLKEPIRIDTQPDLTPEQLGLEESSPKVKEEPQSPAPSPFSGITFSLDPGQISSVPRSVSGGRSNSNRQHAPAAKLDLSGSSLKGAGSVTGGFDFTLSSPSRPSNEGEPSGFFSLSGYASK